MFRRAVVFAIVVAAGCAKQRECRETSDTINAAVGRIQGMTFQADDSAKMMKSVEELGRAAEEEGAKIDKLELTTAELKKLVGEYRTMLTEVAKVSKQLLAAAKQSADLEADAKKSEEEVQQALDAIEAECKGGGSDCTALAEKMAKGPTGEGGDDKAFLASLQRFEADLAKLEPEDPKVAEALAKLVKAIGGQAKLLDKALKAEEDIDEAVKAMDTAVDPEDRIVDELNKFCGATP
jgi:chromosome segregation ATPase